MFNFAIWSLVGASLIFGIDYIKTMRKSVIVSKEQYEEVMRVYNKKGGSLIVRDAISNR